MLENTFDSVLSLALTKKSTKQEVSLWLEEEGFLLARDKLKGITGKELYGMSKDDLRKMLGFAESARLFSKLLKEKERLPVSEQTIKESDFQRFMRIRREDVDSRIPNNPITTFSAPTVPPKPNRPMIREVFHEPDEPVRGKYAEKVRKSKEKSSEKRASKRVEAVPPKEASGKKDRRSKDRKESPDSELSESEEDKKRRHRHKKEKKERREREEGKEKKERHRRAYRSKRSSESASSDSESDESPDSHPKSRHRSRRRERDRKKNQEKEKKKEEQPEATASPPPPQPYNVNPMGPQMSPYAPISPVSPILSPHLHPRYPLPFPDPYTNQMMMQQAQIVRAEQDKFAAEMRLRQLKSGFGAPGALSFPPPMPYQNF